MGSILAAGVLAWLSVCLYASEPSEPKCYSRFDYDEKMLLKVLKFEEKLEKFESLVEQLRKEKQEEQKTFQNRVSELELAFEETQRQLNESLVRMDNDTQRQMNESLVRMDNNTQRQMNESLERMDYIIRHSDKHTEELVRNITTHEDVAFTVKKPAGTSGVFGEIVTNEGSGYSTSDGRFTCRVPGLYFFSAYLVKYRSSRTDIARCYICKNNEEVMQMFIDPEDTTADNGSYGVSSALYVRLKPRDVVSICSCHSSTKLEPTSSFSGLLVSRE